MLDKKNWYPNIRGFLLNSYFLERKELFSKVKSLKKSVSGKVLDIGCGNKPYKHLFEFECMFRWFCLFEFTRLI